MIHQLLSTIGLGVLGIDPITAVYLLAMGMRNEKKAKISVFFFSFAGFSIFIGAALATLFGSTAVEFLERVTPSDNSPFWAALEFAVSVFLLIWVLRKLAAGKKKEEKEKVPVSGSTLKYLSTGLVFALTCFTDPTYYAVLLMGGETGSFFLAALLLAVWFLVSQFMAVMVYLSNEFHLLHRLVPLVEKLKAKHTRAFSRIFYIVLLLVALALLADTAFYLFAGEYLF